MDQGETRLAPDGDAIHVLVASPRLQLAQSLNQALLREPGIRVLDSPVAHPAALVQHVLIERPRVLLLDILFLEVLEPWCLLSWHVMSRPRVLLWCDVASAGLIERVLAHRLRGFLLTSDPPAICLKAMLAVDRGELWLPRALLADALMRYLNPPPSRQMQGDLGTQQAKTRMPLTSREAQVVEHLRQGATNKEIARRLGIMEDTVKKHLQSIFCKLGVHRRGLVMLRQAPDLQVRRHSTFGE